MIKPFHIKIFVTPGTNVNCFFTQNEKVARVSTSITILGIENIGKEFDDRRRKSVCNGWDVRWHSNDCSYVRRWGYNHYHRHTNCKSKPKEGNCWIVKKKTIRQARRKRKQVDIDTFEIVGWVSLPSRYTKGSGYFKTNHNYIYIL